MPITIGLMLSIESFTFGPVQENTYVVYDETSEGIVIDPGCYESSEQLSLTQFVIDQNIQITKVVNTHCHFDHVLGNEFAKNTFKVPLAIPESEKEVLRAVKSYAPTYGFTRYQEAEVDEFLTEDDIVKFGNTTFEILLVPGHSPGHLAFYHAESRTCMGGDVLFQGSIGRTDLPGGDHQTLINSIHEKMFMLPDDVVVYCGHGPPTTIGQEKKTNPFCAIT
ncbi:MAG: MBL fold metallo-hydrolase [Aurantibacter sp.]